MSILAGGRPEDTVVAIVYNPQTMIQYDVCFNWESGQTYAHMNYKVIAVTGDGHMSKEDCQRLYDYERSLTQDCFGLSDTELL